jgi:hypothetical protein
MQRTNQALVGYLARLGWSTHNLAYHLNTMAAILRISARVYPKTPRRWTRAIAPAPNPANITAAVQGKRINDSVVTTSS